MQRRILGCNTEEVKRRERILHNEKSHNWDSNTDLVIIFESISKEYCSYCYGVESHNASQALWPLLVYRASHLNCSHFWFIHQSSLANNQQKHLVVKQEKLGEKWPRILPTSIYFYIFRILQHAVKSYNMGPTALHSLQKKSYWGLLSPLKSIVLSQVWTQEQWVQWQGR
jgi:hypothetical protein